MAMSPDELRLECLRLALSNTTGPADHIVAEAQAYYDFATNTDRAALAEQAKAAIDRAGG